MGRMLGTYAAGALVALVQIAGLHARAAAQPTDGRFLIGGGIEPLSLSWSRTKLEGQPSQPATAAHWGPSGEILLAFGYGLGAWVLALETAFGRTTETTEQVDIVSSASRTEHTLARTRLAFGPSARLLFGEAAVRPFVEMGVGLEMDWTSSGGSESDSLALYARGGPGLQLSLADAASIDLSLRFGYAAASGTLDPDVRVVVLEPGVGVADVGAAEFSSSAIELAAAARLSIWL